jgi:Ca2+-binding RTX toxin-like protein
MFGGTAVPTAVFPALDPGWLFERPTSPVLDDLGVATDWLPLPFPKAASPAVDWEKPLPLFPAETDSLLPSAAVEPWGEELLPFELWSDDGSEVLVGGDGDDLRIGEEGGDLLIGGIGEEAASGTAEAQK